METPTLIIIIIYVVLYLVFLFFKLFPPKEISGLYGYRSRKSMLTIENWRYANKLSANLMLMCVNVLGLLLILFFYLKIKIEYIIIIYAISIFISIIASVVITEIKLKSFTLR